MELKSFTIGFWIFNQISKRSISIDLKRLYTFTLIIFPVLQVFEIFFFFFILYLKKRRKKNSIIFARLPLFDFVKLTYVHIYCVC